MDMAKDSKVTINNELTDSLCNEGNKIRSNLNSPLLTIMNTIINRGKYASP